MSQEPNRIDARFCLPYWERAVAARVVTVFLVAGLAWVLVTDLLLYALVQEPARIARLETAKGWVFIVCASLLLYVVIRRWTGRLAGAHQTIAAIIDSIADGVLLFGADRTIVHANAAAGKMLRTRAPEGLVGLGPVELSRRFRLTLPDGTKVAPEDYSLHRVFRTGGRLRDKVVLHPPGGEELVVITTAAAVRRPGAPTAELVVVVMHDVTELEHLERARDEFLSVAAHSLKTPVAIVKSNARLLRARHGESVQKPAEAIERQCARMERLTENLLTLTRLRAGALRLYVQRLKLGPLVEDAARSMASAWPGHELTHELGEEAVVSADPERLALAVRNVIDEALRCSELGSRVRVLTRRTDHSAEIGVRYQPRSAGEPDPASRYDDLGLRRHIASSVVAAHGGSMRDETAGPARTTWLVLPVLEASHGIRE